MCDVTIAHSFLYFFINCGIIFYIILNHKFKSKGLVMGEKFFTEIDYFVNPNCTNNVVSNPKHINLREFVEHRLNPFNIQPTRKYQLSNLNNESYDYLQFLSNDLVQLNKILVKNIKQAKKIKKDLQSTYGPLYDIHNIKVRRWKTKLVGYDAKIYKKYVLYNIKH